jgi:hypothetical protein
MDNLAGPSDTDSNPLAALRAGQRLSLGLGSYEYTGSHDRRGVPVFLEIDQYGQPLHGQAVTIAQLPDSTFTASPVNRRDIVGDTAWWDPPLPAYTPQRPASPAPPAYSPQRGAVQPPPAPNSPPPWYHGINATYASRPSDTIVQGPYPTLRREERQVPEQREDWQPGPQEAAASQSGPSVADAQAPYPTLRREQRRLPQQREGHQPNPQEPDEGRSAQSLRRPPRGRGR